MCLDIKNYLFCPKSVYASDYFLQHTEPQLFVNNIACFLQGWNSMVKNCLEKLKASIVNFTNNCFLSGFRYTQLCWSGYSSAEASGLVAEIELPGFRRKVVPFSSGVEGFKIFGSFSLRRRRRRRRRRRLYVSSKRQATLTP